MFSGNTSGYDNQAKICLKSLWRINFAKLRNRLANSGEKTFNPDKTHFAVINHDPGPDVVGAHPGQAHRLAAFGGF